MAKEPKFNCIEKWVKKNPPKKFYEFPNQKDNRSYCVMWNNDIKTFWTFWPDFQWTKTVDGVRIEKGEWECDGDEGFIVISEIGKIWKTSDRNWKPYEGNTEENDDDEPTYDKSKFPLKLGSEGPEVAQLQNYLNKLIPFEPLVVNGLFDKKTQDKLIQLQKSLNITK
jgi:hypothetical protein